MYVKIINPPTHGKKVYANRGSARRTANYLQQEAKEQGQTAAFFSSPSHGALTADEVIERLDANHRGLRREEAKFYSLVLNPSTAELQQLGGDEAALARFTCQAMDRYAKNFTHYQVGEERSETDLVWAALIHRERKNRGVEEGKQGEPKPGPQTHVHVIVSARDAAQHVTLNPLTTPARFNRVEYEAKVCVDFVEYLSVASVPATAVATLPRGQCVTEKAQEIRDRAAANRQQKVLTPAQQQAREERLDVQVARLNTKLVERNQLDAQRVKAAAQERGYDPTFYRRLRQLEQNAERGKFTPDPHEYLRTSLVQRSSSVRLPSAVPPPAAAPMESARPMQPHLPAPWQVLAQAVPALPLLPYEPAVRSPEVVRLPAPAVVAEAAATPAEEAAMTAPRAAVPTGEASTPVTLPQPSLPVLPVRVPAQELASVEPLAEDSTRLAAAACIRQQVNAAALMAQQTGVAYAFLLAGQGLELVPPAASRPGGVWDQASGELFSSAEVPVPAAALAATASPLVQYGRILLVDEPRQPAAERLKKWRPYLTEVGVSVGQVVPATPHEPAHLLYCYNVQQADLDQVATRLNALQAVLTARLYEAPHVLLTPASRATGLAVAPAQWPERQGQFNQASFVVAGTPERAAQAERIQMELRRLGAAVGAVNPAGLGELELRATYHTRSPHIEELHTTLQGAAQIKGVILRESESQQFARLVGVQNREESRQKQPGFQREH